MNMGLSYNKPTSKVHVRKTRLQSSSVSGLAFGSEMSGGMSDELAEHLHVYDSVNGIDLKTAKGRGAYIKDIFLSDVYMENVQRGIKATSQFTNHPDDKYDPNALPVIAAISFSGIVVINITTAGVFSGIDKSPFTSICLSNVSLTASYDPSSSWMCAYVEGSSVNVLPDPCPELQVSWSSPSSDCFFLLNSNCQVAAL
ncbi:hypothetical protein SASPL_154635 [Salvia splendens]|uniref:Polygalacturonase n=1 Tax=Salvia splendens TaxID=180675 RepID=A0A8X8YZF5_SALSN|nr:hypothetical protein SASPL_154635 [Salvia splendens]